jgi:pyridoxal phosphate enzyme (YggS family)
MSEVGERTKMVLAELPDHVTLVAVSKTKPLDLVLESYAVGQRHFGENRPQEMRAKWEEAPKDIHWHMIGHLQTNKVKMIIDFVDLIHSVDSIKLLAEIDRRASAIGRVVNVLLQVHIAQEEHKYGFGVEELKTFFEESKWQEYTSVNIQGLMGMASFTANESQLKNEFADLKTLFDSILQKDSDKKLVMNELSMGMSGDYHLAIDQGSTMVRVGSKIFGTR